MRGALRGLLTANARSTFLFTGRYRWAGLEALPAQNRLGLHLPELTTRQTLLLMNALPRLAREPLADKLAAYQRVGGHPKTVELLDGWLADGRGLRALLDDPALGDMLAGEWEVYFLGELGRLLRDAGQTREAVAAFNEALEIDRRLGDPKMGIDLEMLGIIHERQGEHAAALEKYQQALHIFQQVGMAPDAARMGCHIARVREKMGG